MVAANNLEHTPAAVMLDLDGTLIDSRPGVMASIEHALFQSRLAVPNASLAARIGPPLEVMVRELLPDASPEVWSNVIELFREHYDRVGYTGSSPYPGADDALRTMHDAGIGLHVLTNKRQGPAEMMVRAHGWSGFITSVSGASDGPKTVPPEKPKSKPLRGAALIESLGPTSVVVIGDGVDDLATARHIGAGFLLAEWGYGVHEVVAADAGVTRARTFADVPRAVFQLLAVQASPAGEG